MGKNKVGAFVCLSLCVSVSLGRVDEDERDWTIATEEPEKLIKLIQASFLILLICQETGEQKFSSQRETKDGV